MVVRIRYFSSTFGSIKLSLFNSCECGGNWHIYYQHHYDIASNRDASHRSSFISLIKKEITRHLKIHIQTHFIRVVVKSLCKIFVVCCTHSLAHSQESNRVVDLSQAGFAWLQGSWLVGRLVVMCLNYSPVTVARATATAQASGDGSNKNDDATSCVVKSSCSETTNKFITWCCDWCGATFILLLFAYYRTLSSIAFYSLLLFSSPFFFLRHFLCILTHPCPYIIARHWLRHHRLDRRPPPSQQ